MAAIQKLIQEDKKLPTSEQVAAELAKLTDDLAVFVYGQEWIGVVAARHANLLGGWKMALATLAVEKTISGDHKDSVVKTQIFGVRRLDGQSLNVDPLMLAPSQLYMAVNPKFAPQIGYDTIPLGQGLAKTQTQSYSVLVFYRNKIFTRNGSAELVLNHACHLADKLQLHCIPLGTDAWLKPIGLVDDALEGHPVSKFIETYKYLLKVGHGWLAWSAFAYSRHSHALTDQATFALFATIMDCTASNEETIALYLIMLGNVAMRDLAVTILNNATPFESVVHCTELMGWRTIPFGYIGLITDPAHVPRVPGTMLILEETQRDTWKREKKLDKLTVLVYGKRYPGYTLETLVHKYLGCQRLYIQDSTEARALLTSAEFDSEIVRENKEKGLTFFQNRNIKKAQDQLMPGRFKETV